MMDASWDDFICTQVHNVLIRDVLAILIFETYWLNFRSDYLRAVLATVYFLAGAGLPALLDNSTRR